MSDRLNTQPRIAISPDEKEKNENILLVNSEAGSSSIGCAPSGSRDGCDGG